MFGKSLTLVGGALVLLGTVGQAHGSVIGSASVTAAIEIVITDTQIEIDPDGDGPTPVQTFSPGATARISFDYLSDLPASAADYTVDLRLSASSLSAVFANPFPNGPEHSVVELFAASPGSPVLPVFSSSQVVSGLAQSGPQSVPPLTAIFDSLTGGVGGSGSFVIQSMGVGPVPAGALTGSYAFEPSATAAAGSGSVDLRYTAEDLFRTLRDPLLAALPPSIGAEVDATGLAGTGLFDNFVGIGGSFVLELDVTEVAAVPLPMPLTLLSAAVGALFLSGFRRSRSCPNANAARAGRRSANPA